ncbi:reprolysin-like metallopeptidase [Streptomyces diastatochromogenes]|uniref:InlB B-repeat-containing protein n=1 Tax=Streptomyces diastatochromogenes TaxID=42236 RepID=UPI0036616F80
MRRPLLVACIAATALLAPLPLAMATPPADGEYGHHEPWVVRTAVLRANAKEFASLCRTQKEGVPETRTFRLFPGTPGITAMRDYYHKDANGTIYWDGYDPKKPENTVSLSIIGACTRGGHTTLDGVIEIGTKDYLFTPLPKHPGKYRLTEIDTLKLPPSGRPGDTVNLPRTGRPGQPEKTPKADNNNPVAIDLLVPYTPAAVTELGGVTEVQARIRYGVSQINKAFATSHVPASVHVVHSYQTSPSGVANEDANTVLNKLNKRADLTLGATAHAFRDDFGADLVALLASIPAENSSGSADLPIPVSARTSESAYSVTSVFSVKEWDNLGHEIGHNLGMRHDRKTVANNGETPPGPNDTNFGWITSDNKFHTLMAYNTPCLPTCKVINQYSNTVNKTADGKILGDAKNNNAGIAQLATPLVSDYRATKVTNRHTLTMSVSPSGGGSITVSEFGPYDPGTQVTLTAHPAAGFVFAGWEVDGVKQSDTTTNYQITMDKNRSVVALFNPAT